MSNAFTLEDIHAAAQAKYADTEFDINDEKVVLVNALRLSKEKRKKLTDAAKELEKKEDDNDIDMEGFLRKSLRAVAKSESQADILLDAIGNDVAAMLSVFDMYKNGDDLGEASASQD